MRFTGGMQVKLLPIFHFNRISWCLFRNYRMKMHSVFYQVHRVTFCNIYIDPKHHRVNKYQEFIEDPHPDDVNWCPDSLTYLGY